MSRRTLRNLAAGATVVVGLYAYACFALANVYLSPTRSTGMRPAGVDDKKLPLGGRQVPAWITPDLAKGAGASTVFVLAHGYGGSRETWASLFPGLVKHGYSAVAPCMPAHDASPDPTSGFGRKEAALVRNTVDWVRAQYQAYAQPKIILVGISMGGAACWLAAGDGAPVDGVVTEGAFARFDEAMNQFFNSRLPGGSFILRPVITLASNRSGIDPSTINPVESAAKWHGKPSLVIQAENDRLVLRSHATRLAEAAGCPLWIVPNCGHAGCKAAAGEEYLRRLVEFEQSIKLKNVAP